MLIVLCGAFRHLHCRLLCPGADGSELVEEYDAQTHRVKRVLQLVCLTDLALLNMPATTTTNDTTSEDYSHIFEEI